MSMDQCKTTLTCSTITSTTTILPSAIITSKLMPWPIVLFSWDESIDMKKEYTKWQLILLNPIGTFRPWPMISFCSLILTWMFFPFLLILKRFLLKRILLWVKRNLSWRWRKMARCKTGNSSIVMRSLMCWLERRIIRLERRWPFWIGLRLKPTIWLISSPIWIHLTFMITGKSFKSRWRNSMKSMHGKGSTLRIKKVF